MYEEEIQGEATGGNGSLNIRLQCTFFAKNACFYPKHGTQRMRFVWDRPINIQGWPHDLSECVVLSRTYRLGLHHGLNLKKSAVEKHTRKEKVKEDHSGSRLLPFIEHVSKTTALLAKGIRKLNVGTTPHVLFLGKDSLHMTVLIFHNQATDIIFIHLVGRSMNKEINVLLWSLRVQGTSAQARQACTCALWYPCRNRGWFPVAATRAP